MKVAVITPYFKEDIAVLRQCHESVAAQTHAATHFMVADGHPLDEVAQWSVQHVTLPNSHDDNGNTPRAVGSLSAINQGFDAVAYLDADNWFYPNHIANMVTLHTMTSAVVCTSGRSMHRLDGSLMYVDKTENDGVKFADTSCLFLTKGAFRLVPLWALMPKELAPICDQIFWSAIRARKIHCAHKPEATVAFRTQYDVHYTNIGEQPPEGTKTVDESTGKAYQWWLGLDEKDRDDWIRRITTAEY